MGKSKNANIVVQTITPVSGVDVQRDVLNSAVLSAITAGALGAVVQTIVPNVGTAGAQGSVVVTFRAFTVPLSSGEKIKFVLPTTWAYNTPSSSVCTVRQTTSASVTTAVAATSSTGDNVSGEMSVVLAAAVSNDAATTTEITCTIVRTPTMSQSSMSNIVIYTTAAGDVHKDYISIGYLSAITSGALGTTTLTLVPATAKTGLTADLTVSLTPLTNALLSGDKIKFTLPSLWTTTTAR